MEKKKPHYSLSEAQRVVEDRGVNAFTATALYRLDWRRRFGAFS